MTSVAQASSTRARAWRSTILPVSWLWTSMVFSSRWWGWFHNTILEEGHVGLSCYGSYAYVRAYGVLPLPIGDNQQRVPTCPGIFKARRKPPLLHILAQGSTPITLAG